MNAQAIERCAGDIQIVPGNGQLHAIEQADSSPIGLQLEVVELHVRKMRIGAPTVARSIARDQSPRHKAATARAIHVAESGGQQELSGIRADSILRTDGAHHHEGRQDSDRREDFE